MKTKTISGAFEQVIKISSIALWQLTSLYCVNEMLSDSSFMTHQSTLCVIMSVMCALSILFDTEWLVAKGIEFGTKIITQKRAAKWFDEQVKKTTV